MQLNLSQCSLAGHCRLAPLHLFVLGPPSPSAPLPCPPCPTHCPCRVRHTIVLDDPFPDPPTLASIIPDASPEPQFADDGRLEDDWVPQEDERPPEEVEKVTR